MVRTPCRDKNGLKKGTWTPEEDRKLVAYVTRYGCWNWRHIPKFAGLERCGKSCRLRWLNYLSPNVKRGNFTQQEDDLIIRLHAKLGSKWSAIAAELSGRTDNEIKNHWHTNIKKRIQRNSVTPKMAEFTKPNDDSPVENDSGTNDQFSPKTSSSDFSYETPVQTAASNQTLFSDDDFAYLDAYTEPMRPDFWTMADTLYGYIDLHNTMTPLTENQYLYETFYDAELWSGS